MHKPSTLLFVTIITTFSLTTQARPPEVRTINLRGLQIGQATTLTIDGTDLLPAPKVWLNDRALDPIVDEKQSNPNRVVLSLTLPNETPSSFALLRLATVEGVSNGTVIAIDRLPQMPFAESISGLPACLHGTVGGSAISKTSFTGKAGDEVVVEVEAKRLGSKLRPVIHLYDAQRLQIADALPSRSLGGDCRLAVKLPRDGAYSLELHDLQYAAQSPAHFRMKVGQWQFADAAFPSVVTRGQETKLQIIGSKPDWVIPFKAPQLGELLPVPMSEVAALSGLPLTVALSSIPEWIETTSAPAAHQASSNGDVPITTMPVSIHGKLDAPNQRDQYRLATTPGSKLVLEVFADRLGSPIDAVLELRNKDNAVIAAADDQPTTIDPRLEFTVPAGTEFVTAVVRDSLDVGNAHSIYRLVVTSGDKQSPEVSVVAKSDVANVALGSTSVLEVNVTRKNYDGPLKLDLGTLPAGLTVSGTEIPEQSSGTLLQISAQNTSTPVVTSITALSTDGRIGAKLRLETAADDRTPAWLRESFSIAATPQLLTPFSVDWADSAPPTQWVLANKSTVPVKFVRPSGYLGPIRLTLISSQLEPRVNNQPNPTQSVRPERVVEVPLDAPVKAAMDALSALDKQLQEAQKQAASAQGDAKTAADAKVTELQTKQAAAVTALKDTEAKANSTTELALIVPSTLTDRMVDVAIKAEQLNPEKNVALRTVYSTIRRLPVLNPLQAQLEGTTTIEQTHDMKQPTTVTIKGKIERLAELKGDVSVQLLGALPPGVTITNAAVKADQSDFMVSLRFPATQAASEVKGIKLTLIGPPDPMTGNQPIRREIELTIKLIAPTT